MPDEVQLGQVKELGDDVAADDLANMGDAEFAEMLGFGNDDSPESAKPEPVQDTTEFPDLPAKEPEGVELEAEGEEQPQETADEPELEAKEAEGEQEVEEAKDGEAEESADEAEEWTPVTQFQALDADGEEVDVSKIRVKFKAAGKEREEPLDKTVLLAQMGYYNQEREQQVDAAKTFVAETKQENEQLRASLEDVRNYYDRLFSDEEFRERAIEAYARQNSPEERAKRAEEKLRAYEEGTATTEQRQHVSQFLTTRVVPKLTQIAADFPTVSEDEIMGMMMRQTQRLMVNGVIPTSKIAEVERIVDEDIKNLAQQIHLTRTSKAKETEQVLQAEKAKTKQLKRKVARAVKPSGKGKPGATRQKQTEFESAEQWMESTFNSLDGSA